MSKTTENDQENRPLNAYEAKQEARRERYEQRAENAARRSDSRHDAARAQVAGIPFGQPILVGHHSEKRHRRDLAKHDNHMRAAIDESKKADYYASKAASVGTGGISADDPDAVTKLDTKLAKCVERQEFYKRVNAAWRKHQKNPEAPATLKALAALSEQERELVTTYEAQYSWEKGPAQDYQLKNNNAEIRRLKKRIESLKAAAERVAAEPIKGEGYEIVENTEENRVQVIFDGKPAKDVRDSLKSNGFRWAPSSKAWQRQLNNAGIYAAKCVQRYLEENQTPNT
ncbi:MAG: conjugal transfer protein TraC [Legionellaceae bacterium]|nr:conjugal transfer protein TraC [Legionellaceae bacterium]